MVLGGIRYIIFQMQYHIPIDVGVHPITPNIAPNYPNVSPIIPYPTFPYITIMFPPT